VAAMPRYSSITPGAGPGECASQVSWRRPCAPSGWSG
jgi:hypothetical protein